MSMWDVVDPDSLLNLIPFQKRKAKNKKIDHGISQHVDMYMHQQV
jgi:hypothetical protein